MLSQKLLRLLLSSAVLISVLPTQASLAQPEPPAPERTPRQIVDEGFLALQADLAQERPAEAEPLEGIASAAGKLVYQSFRDGNWEIYYGGDEGAGLLRLTADLAADIEPRLSPDASRVVFTSKRTGNYELYIINVDGTGLRQLTNHPAVDGSPAWSPDGRRITFASERDGNPEVYVMNADGSGVVRLTNAPGYDDEPAWSPDGSQIAFTSRRTGDEHSYYIWVMNADGTGVRQLSTHWYSQNPIWSPDGSVIFFDVANDRGWSRLMSIPAVGGTAQPLLPSFIPASYFHVWMGSASFRGGLFLTVAIYAVNGDKLELQDLRLHSVVNNGGWLNVVGPHFGSLNAFPDWRSADLLPPTSTLLTPGGPIPPGPNGWPRVVVAAADAGGAGVARVEIQYRSPSETTWIPGNCGPSPAGTNQYNCDFLSGPAAYGRVFYVRVRAVDAMDNAEAWPIGDGMRVVPYYRNVPGTLLDNRGAPVYGANVVASAAIHPPVISDPAGRFDLYFSGTGSTNSYTITARNLWAPITREATWASDGQPIEQQINLSPANNLLSNGTFDAGQQGWLILPVGSSNVGPLGQQAPSNGLVMRSFTVTQTIYWSGLTSLGAQYRPGGFTVIGGLMFGPGMRNCYAQGHCDYGHALNALRVDGWAFGPDSTLYTVGRYPASTDVVFRQYTPGGQVSESVTVTSIETGAYSQLLHAPDGQLHWLRTDATGRLFHFIRQTDGAWTNALVTTSFEAGAAVVGPAGQLSLAGCRGSEALYFGWTASSGWSSPEVVSTVPCTSALVAVDDSGVVFAQWRGTGAQSQQFAVREPTGGWRLAPVPSATLFQAGNGSGYWLVAPSRPHGTLSLVDLDGGRLNVIRLQRDGTWSARVRLAERPPVFGTEPAVYAIDEGRQSLLYTDRRPNPEVPNSQPVSAVTNWRYGPDPAVGSSVEQTVTIPATMSSPTLSFYATFGNIGQRFRVAIRDSSGAVSPVFTSQSTTYAALSYWWSDLSAWRGQTVTVLIQVMAEGDNSQFDQYPVKVDDVWLSDWATPIIESVSPTIVPSEGAILTVTGRNLSGASEMRLDQFDLGPLTEVSTGVYTIAVPAGAPPGARVLNASNPGSFDGGFTQPVWIGRTLYLPVVTLWSRR